MTQNIFDFSMHMVAIAAILTGFVSACRGSRVRN